ncbi:hypothetical protein GFL49_08725 [Rhizobium leguminosarum bv. viciae]|nr:hypothetical protein [Rhizobium leguminosarum bv. viciae]NKL33900.1 hypothetical protein [Rhizobium leguminosarum bv. viciae]
MRASSPARPRWSTAALRSLAAETARAITLCGWGPFHNPWERRGDPRDCMFSAKGLGSRTVRKGNG